MAHADDDYAVVAVLDVNYCDYFADGYCLWPKLKHTKQSKTNEVRQNKKIQSFADLPHEWNVWAV